MYVGSGEQVMESWGEGKDTVTQFFFQAWSAKVPRVARGIPENPLSVHRPEALSECL